jgi:hypothetical protein
MRSSHSLDRLDVAFDDDRLVADAGLLLPATLAHHLGLGELVDRHLDLGDKPGRAHVGDKLLTLVASALAGGDCIDDADALRAGAPAGSWASSSRPPRPRARFCAASAGATSASSMRVSRELLERAWASGAGPGADPSRSISTRRSARRTAWPRWVPSTTATPMSAAITRSWRWRRGPLTS